MTTLTGVTSLTRGENGARTEKSTRCTAGGGLRSTITSSNPFAVSASCNGRGMPLAFV